MTVLIDLTSLSDNFSGIERFALNITKELINISDIQDMNFILVFKNKIHKEFLEYKENIRKVILKGKNKLFFYQITLLSCLLKNKADCFFFPAFPAPFFFFNKKSVSVIHDLGCWDCPGSNKFYMIAYFKLMYWKAALGRKKIVTVSEFSKKRIEVVLNKQPQDIYVLYNGLSDIFRNFVFNGDENAKAINMYNLPSEYMLCLSTLEPRKNLKLLVKAYDDLLSNGLIDIDLVLAGRKGWEMDGFLSNLSEKTVSHIHITGFIRDDMLPYVYRNAKLFVFPSLYEGFGIPPIEAMSMGIPVVSSNAASLPEILDNSTVYFNNNNLESLKHAIVKVLSFSDKELFEVKRKGKIQSQKYNWKREAFKLKNILVH